MDLILLKPGDDTIVGENLIVGPVDGVNKPQTDKAKPNPNDGKQAIQLLSVSYGMSQQITTDVSNTARTSGKPNIQDLTCVKYMDYSSPKLYRSCLDATPIGVGDKLTYVYLCRNSGGKIINIMTYALKDALISSLHCQANPGDMPTETFTLNFTQIAWNYLVQKSDTSVGGNIGALWDVTTNSGK